MDTSKTSVIIVAAGSGSRMGGDVPKQFRILGGKPLLRHTIDGFLSVFDASQIQLVVNPNDTDLVSEATEGLALPTPVYGGETRQQSVKNGLDALAAVSPAYVLIHDAARPFFTDTVLYALIEALNKGANAALPTLPIVDTLKRGTGAEVVETVEREGLYVAQTPQAFPYPAIMKAHKDHAHASVTDDIALMELAGHSAHMVMGDEKAFKITHDKDLKRAEEILMTMTETRMGHGFDVHAFEDGTHVTLCGVDIPHDKALKGHSDADVAMHALTDAIYGAMAEGDIGVHFPPSDPQWKGAASEIFLTHACQLVTSKGGNIANVDVTIICEAPKIAPHQAAMRAKLAAIMAIDVNRISVKATTTEKLGYTGRGEGIAAEAIATLTMSKS